MSSGVNCGGGTALESAGWLAVGGTQKKSGTSAINVRAEDVCPEDRTVAYGDLDVMFGDDVHSVSTVATGWW